MTYCTNSTALLQFTSSTRCIHISPASIGGYRHVFYSNLHMLQLVITSVLILLPSTPPPVSPPPTPFPWAFPWDPPPRLYGRHRYTPVSPQTTPSITVETDRRQSLLGKKNIYSCGTKRRHHLYPSRITHSGVIGPGPLFHRRHVLYQVRVATGQLVCLIHRRFYLGF